MASPQALGGMVFLAVPPGTQNLMPMTLWSVVCARIIKQTEPSVEEEAGSLLRNHLRRPNPLW
jgi:hypothetical protein